MILPPSSGTTDTSTSSIAERRKRFESPVCRVFKLSKTDCLALSTFIVFIRFQKIGGQRVIRDRVAARFAAAILRLPFLAKTKLRLRLQKQRRGFLPKLQVVVEQQHRRQRRGEVINLRRRLLQFPRVGQQIAEKFFRLRCAGRAFPTTTRSNKSFR